MDHRGRHRAEFGFAPRFVVEREEDFVTRLELVDFVEDSPREFGRRLRHTDLQQDRQRDGQKHHQEDPPPIQVIEPVQHRSVSCSQIRPVDAQQDVQRRRSDPQRDADHDRAAAGRQKDGDVFHQVLDLEGGQRTRFGNPAVSQ